jgi:hypothetical protein
MSVPQVKFLIGYTWCIVGSSELPTQQQLITVTFLCQLLSNFPRQARMIAARPQPLTEDLIGLNIHENPPGGFIRTPAFP